MTDSQRKIEKMARFAQMFGMSNVTSFLNMTAENIKNIIFDVSDCKTDEEKAIKIYKAVHGKYPEIGEAMRMYQEGKLHRDRRFHQAYIDSKSTEPEILWVGKHIEELGGPNINADDYGLEIDIGKTVQDSRDTYFKLRPTVDSVNLNIELENLRNLDNFLS